VRSPTARRARAGTSPLAAALCAVALSAAGCGSDSEASAGPEPEAEAPSGEVVDIAGTEPVGEMTAGSVASLVECRDWNEADEGERLATIADVRSQINLQDSGIDAPALTDEESARMFDNSCRPAWAQGFRLYKLYARAAGWVQLERIASGETP